MQQESKEKGVTPVVGIVLIVAITVTIAGIIGGFALELGEKQETTPQAVWDWQQNGNAVVLTHDGGDKVDGSNLYISKKGTSTKDRWTDSSGINGPKELTAGMGAKITNTDTTFTFSNGDTMQLIWQGDTGNSNILSSYVVK